MIHKIVFCSQESDIKRGLFLLLENAKANGIFDLINTGLVFDRPSTNKIKLNHIKTMLCGYYIGFDRLERVKLLQGDPLLGNFNHKTTRMMREINFQVFKEMMRKKKLKSIPIDIDSSVVMAGHREGAARGYNSKKPGSNGYNIPFAFCDELKAYITGLVRSGNIYTANGAAEMIKEIVVHITCA